MKLLLEARPGELEGKTTEFVKAVKDILEGVDPELAEQLEKALPRKESELKFAVLRGIQKREEAEYARQLDLMTKRIMGVLEQGAKKSETDTDTDIRKGGPYIGPRGGKWADAAHTIPWKESTVADYPKSTMARRLELVNKRIKQWKRNRESKPTIHADQSSKTVMEIKDRFLGHMNRFRHSNPDQFEKWKYKFDEAARELRERREYYGNLREKMAIEEGLDTGKLTVSDSEISEMLGNPGDVYRDHNWKGERNDKLFRVSDLSGKKIRHYIKLPDGRIGHPDEIHESRKRGRIVTVDSVKIPSEYQLWKSEGDTDTDIEKGGPYIGPKGGKWADPQFTIPWKEGGDKEGTGTSLEGLQGHLKEKYGVSLSLTENRGGTIELTKIVVPKERRNEGVGSKVMGTILGYADQHGKTVTLDPSTDFGGTKGKLIKFYKRHGFVENKGRNKDYEISRDMYRLPKVKKSLSPDYSEDIVEKEEDRYEQVKRTLIGRGYVEADFEEGGPLYGKSTNELIDMIRDKRDD